MAGLRCHGLRGITPMKRLHLYPSTALHGRIAHEIGRKIASGAFASGDVLPREAELAEQLSASRQAVREGLKVLAAKGLVASKRRAGTYVLPRSQWNLLDPDVLAWHPIRALTPEFLADLVELRRLLEPAAAAMAAGRGEPRKIACIGKALEDMRQVEHDTEAFYAADAAFHAAIFSASGNDMIERIGTLLTPLLRASFPIHYVGATVSLQSPDAIAAVVRSSVDQHGAVYEAIAAGDTDRAWREAQALLTRIGREVGGLVQAQSEEEALERTA